MDGRTSLGFCVLKRRCASQISLPFLFLHFPFTVLQVFGMERQKKIYPYAFLLVIVNELGCTNRDSGQKYHIGAQVDKTETTNPHPNPPQANLESGILVHKFLNV